MRAKLIKSTVQYRLLNEDGIVIATSFYNGKLSIKNCEAIANGYDLDELAENAFGDNDAGYVGFKLGFQKALEILGDKKFSEVDVKKAYMIGWNSCSNFNGNDESQEFIESPGCIQSLKQTEWEVEIEMDMILVGQCDCPCHSDKFTIMHFMACCHPERVETPKLDADGCLILKRI